MPKLFAHQKELIRINPSKYILAWSCGTGKTIGALALAHHNNVDALIITPKSLQSQWARAVAPFEQKHYIISKETFRRDWDKLPRYEALIVDECHAFCGMKSQMSKSLERYIKKHNPKYIWLLSATPVTSTPWSVFRLAGFLGHKFNYYSFKNKYFFDVRMGPRMIQVVKKGMDEELSNEIKTFGDVVSLENCADVPDQVFEDEYLDLTPQQVKGIKELDDSSFIARFTHHHEIEQGIKKSDDYTPDQYFESLKTQRVVSYCEENPKVAVFCRYNLQIFHLKDVLEKKGFKVFILNGDVKDRDAIVQEVEKTDRCVVLIQSDTSVGYELPSIPVIIFASLSYSYLSYTQAIGRFNRINRLKKNFYVHLIIKGGPDEAIWKCIQRHEDFYVELYHGKID